MDLVLWWLHFKSLYWLLYTEKIYIYCPMSTLNNNNNNDDDDDNYLEVAHPLSGSSSTRFLIDLEFGNVGF